MLSLTRSAWRPALRLAAAAGSCLAAASAQAAHLSGDTLDTVANVLSWVVLVVVPVVGIWLFLLVHVLPEKIAENKGHPQTDAIKVLCLLSLVFGGLLWPLAWLWAYSKPVLHKLAYGVDRVDHHPPEGSGDALTPLQDAESNPDERAP